MKIRIFAILITFLALMGFKGCPKNGGSIPQSGAIRTSTKVVQATPKGAHVFSENGVSAASLEAIDADLTKTFQAAATSGYTNHVGDYGFQEFFIPMDGCELSRVQGIPSFRIRADNYDGSEFDLYNPKGVGVRDGIGVIYAAEMILSVGTPQSTPAIGQSVICDSAIIGTAARNGAEHILAANNDVDYFVRTQTHTNGCGHPILPESNCPAMSVVDLTDDGRTLTYKGTGGISSPRSGKGTIKDATPKKLSTMPLIGPTK